MSEESSSESATQLGLPSPEQPTPSPAISDTPELVPGEIRHLSGAIVAAIAGIALSSSAEIGAVPLLVAVAILQASVIVSWVFGTRTPGRYGTIILAGAAAAGADVAVSISPHGQLGALLPVLGFAVPVMFAHQLQRGIARSRVVESLANIAVLIAAVVAVVALVQLRHETSGSRITSAIAGAVALALLVGYLADMTFSVARFDPEVPRGFLGVLLGAFAGAVVAYLALKSMFEFGGGRSLFLGFSVGLVANLLAVGTGFVQQSSEPASPRVARLRPIYAVLIPICFICPIGYLLCLAIRS